MKNIHLFTSITCLMVYSTIAEISEIPEVGRDNYGTMRGRPQRESAYLDYKSDSWEFYDTSADVRGYNFKKKPYGTKDPILSSPVSEGYCTFLKTIGSDTACYDPCEWWNKITDTRDRSFCTSNYCDVNGNNDISSNNAPCVRKSNYIITTPILHRPSGLSEPEICECVDPTDKYGETCKRHDPLYPYHWCYLKNDKSYCPRAHDVNHDGKFRLINSISGSGNDCQGSQNKEDIQDKKLKEWQLGNDDQAVYREDRFTITYVKRQRTWSPAPDTNGHAVYVDTELSIFDWHINNLGTGFGSSAYTVCPYGIRYAFISNLFAVHVPECRDTEEYDSNTQDYKTRSNCISFVTWQRIVVDNMDRNKLTEDDGYKLVSKTNIRFELPNNVEIELYDDISCGNRANNDRMNKNGRIRIANAADLTSYSWKFRRTDNKRCLSATGNGQCIESDKIGEYAIEIGWNRNAETTFNCHIKEDGEHHYRVTQTSDQTGSNCGMQYKQWKECPANMRANVALDNCEVCGRATPSRPAGTRHCVACRSGQWFPNWGQAGSACDFLGVVVYEKGTDAQGTGWRIQKGPDIIGLATSHLNYYATSTDQTIRNVIPIGWYMSYPAQKAELTQCVNKQDEEDYMYRNYCGAQEYDTPLTGYDPWFYRNGVYFKKDNLPVGIHQIAMGGNKMRCLDCNNDSFEGSYNSNCKANQPQLASNCVACKRLKECVAQDSYLDHFYTGDGCKNPDAVTDTECKKCPVIRVRGPDSHNIVVGCGRTALSRWNDETGEIGDEDGPVMCGYKDYKIATPTTAAVFIGDSPKCTYMGKELEQSNNYDEGRTRTLPTDIPYCPPGYWIDVNKAGCITDEWTKTWIHACCRPCRGCPPHEKKIDGFQKCAGNKRIDTEASQCTAMCPTGYWNDENQENTDSAGMCVKCKTSCSS